VDASEAREHIEMVERIIAQSSRHLRVGGEFFLVWGLVGGVIDILITLALGDRISTTVFYTAYAVLIAFGIVFSAMRGRYYGTRSEQMTYLQREFLNVLWLAIALAFIANATMFRLFGSVTALMALWSFAEIIVLFYIGMHGNRRALAGGIVILASMVAANFALDAAGWILAAGVLLGYAGFGAAELLAGE
jgi:hypothetical protein